ncbi:helix-turn-helix domain-containing protein [Nocardiopsis sp. CNT-189]|uniref:helix-turn-helix domain-containing protein n=1 Tax=Nocardiopsis oceanisediminis TaxID=2816862 RepID=UPI003B2EA625
MVERDFGSYLANERKQAGHTLRKLASLCQRSPASLSRWENNQVTPSRGDVELLDKALKARGRLLTAWEMAMSDGLPSWMHDLGRLEEAAETIELISPHAVPGLLQSAGYLRLVMKEGLHPGTPEEIERLISLRSSRYDVLRSRNDPNIVAVFPMTALTCVSEEVRKEQAAHLLCLGEREQVTIHVIPEGAILLGVTSMLLMFHLRDGRKAASSDHVRGNIIYQDTDRYDRLHGLVKRSLGCALPPAQSRKALEELL